MPSNESTSSGKSAVSGELMLKCRSRPTASPAEPAALEQVARADRAGRDHDLVGLDLDALPARAVAADDAPGTLDLLDVHVRHQLEPEVVLRLRQHGVERGELGAVAAADVAVAGGAAGGGDVRVHPLELAGQVELAHGLLEALGGLGDRGLGDRRHAEPGAHVRDRRLQRGAVEPARLPLLEHELGRVEAERVVDRGAAADAHALEHLQAEVGGELERALVVEAQVLDDLVVAELARVDVRAALEHQHLAAGLGEAVGEDPAGGARADDDGVVAAVRRLLERHQRRRVDRVLGQRQPAVRRRCW